MAESEGRGQAERAHQHFVQFEKLFEEMDPEMKENDPDVLQQRTVLLNALNAHQCT